MYRPNMPAAFVTMIRLYEVDSEFPTAREYDATYVARAVSALSASAAPIAAAMNRPSSKYRQLNDELTYHLASSQRDLNGSTACRS